MLDSYATNPTATEIFEMSERFGIEVDDLRAPLDEEERTHVLRWKIPIR